MRDIWGAFDRSTALGAIVMVATVLFSFLAGLAFRRRFPGATALFYVVIASLVMPSVVVSLGIGAMFEMLGIERAWYSSALGAHLTWTLPFGLLIMLAVFNRFNPAYEEAARDLGAKGSQTIRYVVVPIIAPSLAESIWNGSVTVMAVILAPSSLAKRTPCSTALAARSDPSVGIRMFLYKCGSPPLGVSSTQSIKYYFSADNV